MERSQNHFSKKQAIEFSSVRMSVISWMTVPLLSVLEWHSSPVSQWALTTERSVLWQRSPIACTRDYTNEEGNFKGDLVIPGFLHALLRCGLASLPSRGGVFPCPGIWSGPVTDVDTIWPLGLAPSIFTPLKSCTMVYRSLTLLLERPCG